MILAWQVYEYPVSALDVVATALTNSDLKTKPADFDGVNLIPCLNGEN